MVIERGFNVKFKFKASKTLEKVFCMSSILKGEETDARDKQT